MVTKLTARQQAFVREYLIDLNATQAAIRAGYSAKTARVTGAENLTKPAIAAAVSVQQQRRARKADITIETLTAELEQARRLALKEKQSGAAVSATLGKAKLHGLIVEKHKHSGAIGSYDLSKVSDADLDKLESILGSVTAAGGDPGGESSPGG